MNRTDKVARAMAAVEGHNPDKPLVVTAQVMGQAVGLQWDAATPAWQYYVRMAKLFLAALAAASE